MATTFSIMRRKYRRMPFSDWPYKGVRFLGTMKL
jgi:hypothetical protein